METVLDGAMILWFVLTAVCLLLLVWDLFTNAPVSAVQKLGWILVVFYTGPIGFIAFLYACRRPFPGGHDRYTRATWKQGVNSEVHCLAGDATGILIAAVIASALSVPTGWEIVLEYVAGFVCGLFIFQALMMIGMFEGRYWLAVRKTFFAETVSMNFVMVGMIPTMLLLANVWPDSREPTEAAFWFRMSLATVVGGVTAFPINRWLVARGLKHGCMTISGADDPPATSHRSGEVAAEHHHDGHASASDHMAHGTHSMHGGSMDHGSMGHGGMDHGAMGHGGGSAEHESGHSAMGHGDHDGQAGHRMASLAPGKTVAWLLGTTILFVAVVVAVGLVTPIPFD